MQHRSGLNTDGQPETAEEAISLAILDFCFKCDKKDHQKINYQSCYNGVITNLLSSNFQQSHELLLQNLPRGQKRHAFGSNSAGATTPDKKIKIAQEKTPTIYFTAP